MTEITKPTYQISKMTFGYDAVEDRVFIRANLKNQPQVIRLWLTANLIYQLVPKLTKFLPQEVVQAPAAVNAQNSTSAKNPSAQSRKTAVAQVKTSPETVDNEAVEEQEIYWLDALIQILDIKKQPNGVVVWFRFDEMDIALLLETHVLKNWLQILYKTCQRSHWSLAIWPAWIARQERDTHLALLH